MKSSRLDNKEVERKPRTAYVNLECSQKEIGNCVFLYVSNNDFFLYDITEGSYKKPRIKKIRNAS